MWSVEELTIQHQTQKVTVLNVKKQLPVSGRTDGLGLLYMGYQSVFLGRRPGRPSRRVIDDEVDDAPPSDFQPFPHDLCESPGQEESLYKADAQPMGKLSCEPNPGESVDHAPSNHPDLSVVESSVVPSQSSLHFDPHLETILDTGAVRLVKPASKDLDVSPQVPNKPFWVFGENTNFKLCPQIDRPMSSKEDNSTNVIQGHRNVLNSDSNSPYDLKKINQKGKSTSSTVAQLQSKSSAIDLNTCEQFSIVHYENLTSPQNKSVFMIETQDVDQRTVRVMGTGESVNPIKPKHLAVGDVNNDLAECTSENVTFNVAENNSGDIRRSSITSGNEIKNVNGSKNSSENECNIFSSQNTDDCNFKEQNNARKNLECLETEVFNINLNPAVVRPKTMPSLSGNMCNKQSKPIHEKDASNALKSELVQSSPTDYINNLVALSPNKTDSSPSGSSTASSSTFCTSSDNTDDPASPTSHSSSTTCSTTTDREPVIRESTMLGSLPNSDTCGSDLTGLLSSPDEEKTSMNEPSLWDCIQENKSGEMAPEGFLEVLRRDKQDDKDLKNVTESIVDHTSLVTNIQELGSENMKFQLQSDKDKPAISYKAYKIDTQTSEVTLAKAKIATYLPLVNSKDGPASVLDDQLDNDNNTDQVLMSPSLVREITESLMGSPLHIQTDPQGSHTQKLTVIEEGSIDNGEGQTEAVVGNFDDVDAIEAEKKEGERLETKSTETGEDKELSLKRSVEKHTCESKSEMVNDNGNAQLGQNQNLLNQQRESGGKVSRNSSPNDEITCDSSPNNIDCAGTGLDDKKPEELCSSTSQNRKLGSDQNGVSEHNVVSSLQNALEDTGVDTAVRHSVTSLRKTEPNQSREICEGQQNQQITTKVTVSQMKSGNSEFYSEVKEKNGDFESTELSKYSVLRSSTSEISTQTEKAPLGGSLSKIPQHSGQDTDESGGENEVYYDADAYVSSTVSPLSEETADSIPCNPDNRQAMRLKMGKEIRGKDYDTDMNREDSFQTRYGTEEELSSQRNSSGYEPPHSDESLTIYLKTNRSGGMMENGGKAVVSRRWKSPSRDRGDRSVPTGQRKLTYLQTRDGGTGKEKVLTKSCPSSRPGSGLNQFQTVHTTGQQKPSHHAPGIGLNQLQTSDTRSSRRQSGGVSFSLLSPGGSTSSDDGSPHHRQTSPRVYNTADNNPGAYLLASYDTGSEFGGSDSLLWSTGSEESLASLCSDLGDTEVTQFSVHADWMTSLPERLHTQPLASLAIPGSHISLAIERDLRTDMDISPCNYEMAEFLRKLPNLSIFNSFRNIVKKIWKAWMGKQTLSVSQQLYAGIRYLDIRVTKYRSALYAEHGLYSRQLPRYLKEIKLFLDSHPKEIVILHIGALNQINLADKRKFVTILFQVFGAKMAKCPKDIKDVTLESLWRRKKQVIIIFPEEDVTLLSNHIFAGLIWSDVLIKTRQCNTHDTEELAVFLEKAYTEDLSIAQVSKRKTFHVMRAVLSPDMSLVFGDYHYSSMREMTLTVTHPVMENWIEGRKNLNIVACDFVGNGDMVAKVIGLNASKFAVETFV